MYGFKPSKQAGGMVRGPGSGTSDSISKEVPAGTFIMPADSTAKIGAEALAAAGRGFPGARRPAGGATSAGVPVRLSNGEFEVPPEQVHALGAQVLDAAREATHTPVAQARPEYFFADGGEVAARGFRPGMKPARAAGPGLGFQTRRGYADGGLVDDEQKRRLAQAATAGMPTPSPSAPAAPAAAPAPSLSYADNNQAVGQSVRNAWDRGQYANAVGQAAAGGLGVITTPAIDMGTRAAGAAYDAAKGFGQGLFGVSATPAAAPSTSPVPVAAPAAAGATPRAQQPSTPAPAPQAAASEAGGVPLAIAAPAPGAAAAASPAPQAAGFPPAQAASSDRVAQMNRDAAASRALSQASIEQARQGIGVPATPGLGMIGPVDYANRNADFNDSAALRTAAARGASPGRSGAAVYQAQLQAAAAPLAQRAQMRQAEMEQGGATQRARIGAAADMARTTAQEAGQNQRQDARLALEGAQQTAAAQLARDRFGLEQTAQGFQTRAAAQEEQLRNVLLDPNATTTQRQQAQSALLALKGKSDPANRFIAVQGGQTVDASGQVVKEPSRVFDAQERQFIDPRPAGPSLPPGMTRQVGTSGGKPVYEDANGKRFIAN
ncbi:hypothetical protein ABIC63_000501 [Pseudacidovorax sp. 1753]|uniref:hypothetical protein n=1 Tax=Pseudacidovorax sp. 1753 TaxID=3156419 RepID=UPI00339A3FF8